LRGGRFGLLPQPELLSFFLPKKKVTKEKGHPIAAPGAHRARTRSVRLGRAFRQDVPVLSKRHGHPCPCPLRGLVVQASLPLKGTGRSRSRSRAESREPRAEDQLGCFTRPLRDVRPWQGRAVALTPPTAARSDTPAAATHPRPSEWQTGS